MFQTNVCTENENTNFMLCTFFDAPMKLLSATINLVMSVYSSICPSAQGTNRFPLNGFSLNLIFKNFLIICSGNLISLNSENNNAYFT